MSAISLAIAGAAGRMGKGLIALLPEHPGVFVLSTAIDAPHCPLLGKDAGTIAGTGPVGVALTATLAGNPDVLIDFSTPAATRSLLAQCIDRKIAMVIGTTGLTPADHDLIAKGADSIPILQATNTSLGVNVLLAVAAQVARQLGAAYDIEIVEAHHNQKKDAPSGTALSLAESICEATGRTIENDLVYGRGPQGSLTGESGAAGDTPPRTGPAGGMIPPGPRKPGSIGIHGVRMGDVVGEHTIYYATAGERVEIRHVATSRDTFARGALRAAEFLAKQRAGRYTMANVLGL